jgi:hypothetical protein
MRILSELSPRVKALRSNSTMTEKVFELRGHPKAKKA